MDSFSKCPNSIYDDAKLGFGYFRICIFLWKFSSLLLCFTFYHTTLLYITLLNSLVTHGSYLRFVISFYS